MFSFSGFKHHAQTISELEREPKGRVVHGMAMAAPTFIAFVGCFRSQFFGLMSCVPSLSWQIAHPSPVFMRTEVPSRN
jgi:hypothetical protein